MKEDMVIVSKKELGKLVKALGALAETHAKALALVEELTGPPAPKKERKPRKAKDAKITASEPKTSEPTDFADAPPKAAKFPRSTISTAKESKMFPNTMPGAA